MKREPSIHITQSRLRQLMRQFHDYDDNADDMINDMMAFIVQEAHKYTLEKRSISMSNQSVAKKVMKKVVNDKSDSQLLSTIIFSVRKSLRHRGIKPITNDSREWAYLNKLTPIINQFCEDFGLSKRDGYIKYVKTGIEMITTFNHYVVKLYDMSERISTEYEAIEKINADTNKTLTKKIHDYYVQKIVKRTGINDPYDEVPTKYIYFIAVREIVEKTKVNYQTYIDAQFEGLEWANTYPQPEQLISQKSNDRLNKFVYKNHVEKEDKPDEGLTNILNSIKNGKNHH